jgi:outer membrane protein X
MKKLMMIAMMMLMGIGAFAQEGKMAVGVNVGIAPSLMKEYNPVILGAKFQYEFVENFRAELAGNLFTKKNGYGLWDAELNFHYLFPVADGIKVYPAAGAVLMGTMIKDANKNYTGFGFNAGAGVEYTLSNQLKFNCDVKYLGVSKKESGEKVIDASGVTIAVGIAYVF